MAKKLKFKTGDIFSLEVAKNEFMYGRIVFDVTNQYMKSVYPKNQEEGVENYLDSFNGCFLVETFLGLHKSLKDVDFDKKAVQGTFVTKNFYDDDFFSERNFAIETNIPIDPRKVSFPETLSLSNGNVYFSNGELYLPIPIDQSTYYDEIKVMPSFGYGYRGIIVPTLGISNREDLLEEDDKEKYNYFRYSDLKSSPDIRTEIYAMIGENPNISYYELALKHGFDLARLYNVI